MAGTHSYNTTGIAARGRIYLAGDNKVYAFVAPAGVPTPTPTPSGTPSPTPTGMPSPSVSLNADTESNTEAASDSSVAPDAAARP